MDAPSGVGASPISESVSTMKLGAAYNVFDGEELLTESIRSIRSCVDHVVVVYQTRSNFGAPANSHLESLLHWLRDDAKLVDELVLYEPKRFATEERVHLLSPSAPPDVVGGSVDSIGDQFFNEVAKRDLGRKLCQQAGCTHFMSLDTDEFYIAADLERVKRYMMLHDVEATACRMRLFVKQPTWEYFPFDNQNAVTLIYKLAPKRRFRLAVPSNLLLDPTRKMEPAPPIHLFERTTIEMFHMTLVRINMKSKLTNVSNRDNLAAQERFLRLLPTWDPSQMPIHPHPIIGALFTSVRIVPNYFNVHLDRVCALCLQPGATKRCSACKAVVYCVADHQRVHWKKHKGECRKLKNKGKGKGKAE